MDKEAWNKLKKDLNKLPAQEKLLYLKGILNVVKEKELREEILLELKKTQEIIDNETIPGPERATIPIPEPIRLRNERQGLEQEIGEAPSPERELGVNYGVSKELEKASIYGRERESFYKESNTYRGNKDESPLDMMREGERRAEENYTLRRDSILGQESVSRKKKDEGMYK